MTGMPRLLIAAVFAVCLVSGCQGVRNFLRDPAGDDRIFAGDPNLFLGKEVIVQFRWGDPGMYGAAITCVIVGVEAKEIVVRGLYMDTPADRMRYPKLLRLGKLLPVEGQPDVFRIRRDDICRIFESATVRPEE
jgi:hypothetical protein